MTSRRDDDHWDITENVGTTALQVAMGRMAETASPGALFQDPYAQDFVEAAIDRGWRHPFEESSLSDVTALDEQATAELTVMLNYIAARTRFFDDFVVAATADGIDQIVILAAGLDARAWRLPWPQHSTVFEIDQPKVLAFKEDTLRARGQTSLASYVPVASDLRQDWTSDLRARGFDPRRPTAWLAEGLLPYLSAASQDALFERIDDVSCAGSQIAVEAFTDTFFDPESESLSSRAITAVRQAAAPAGAPPMQPGELFFLEERADVSEWLQMHGWHTTSLAALDLLARYGRPAAPSVASTVVKSVFVTGRRTATPAPTC